MRVSVKAEYAVRAAVQLAAVGNGDHRPVKGEEIADAQGIPLRFLENILSDLRHQGVIHSRRGIHGGYWLNHPPASTTLAEIIRAVDRPLASVGDERPEDLEYRGDAKPLQDVWIALRANIREVLEAVTLADVVSGDLPQPILRLASSPEAWRSR
jgi:Rrf2 family protein